MMDAKQQMMMEQKEMQAMMDKGMPEAMAKAAAHRKVLALMGKGKAKAKGGKKDIKALVKKAMKNRRKE